MVECVWTTQVCAWRLSDTRCECIASAIVACMLSNATKIACDKSAQRPASKCPCDFGPWTLLRQSSYWLTPRPVGARPFSFDRLSRSWARNDQVERHQKRSQLIDPIRSAQAAQSTHGPMEMIHGLQPIAKDHDHPRPAGTRLMVD